MSYKYKCPKCARQKETREKKALVFCSGCLEPMNEIFEDSKLNKEIEENE